MNMVRQWMIKPGIREWRLMGLLPIAALAVLAACNPTELKPTANNSQIAYDGSYANRAFIYPESPAIIAGAKYGPRINIDAFLDKGDPKIITENNQLKGDCSMQFNYYYIPYRTEAFDDECIHSYGTKGALEQIVPRQADGTWIFGSGTKEFYQVNALYHLQKGVNKFFDKLKFAYQKLHGGTTLLTTPKSMPPYLKSSNLFWFKGVSNDDSVQFKNEFLTSYATCNNVANAYFSPAGPELCFGADPAHPNFYIVQDPSVIYHELGHALISVMMNMRNGTNTTDYTTFRSNLNSFGYDESGSLGEGLADYYSYVITGRTHVGEWALGRFDNQSRPLTETDPLHISGIDATSEGRLSYPQYLLYDPNDPDSPFEDVHYAGQIVSHYMVALTETLKNKCVPDTGVTAQETATSYVMLLLAETLSEIGDLRSVGIDTPTSAYTPGSTGPFFNNLDPSSSYMWAHLVNPPTYRRFFQTFAKNIKKFVAGTGKFCSAFTVLESEKLLDDYGLLLFKTYNDNGNSTKNKSYYYRNSVGSYPAATLSSVTESNRRKSILVSKDLLSLADPNTAADRASYYIVDDATTMQTYLSNLLFKGIAVSLSANVASTEYNNNNIKISPGEIVAVIPNLYNASNSAMAGVQILANDWDHVQIDSTLGTFKPCVVDTVTTVDQGAIPSTLVGSTCDTTMTEYKRYVKDTTTLLYPTEAAAPVCMVEMDDGVSTKWVSQNQFRKKQGLSLSDKDCLGYSTSGLNSDQDFSFNPHECLVRVLPGSADANFSKINPQKSYIETIRSTTNTNTFNVGNAIVLEINKWIPPGTKFRCRLRAKFSNCSDCFTDATNTTHPGDDYVDAEYNGSKPFKIINFEFDVND